LVAWFIQNRRICHGYLWRDEPGNRSGITEAWVNVSTPVLMSKYVKCHLY
jgi:hypothetical protein